MDAERLRAVWENEIDRLELEVLRIERLIRGLVSVPEEPWRAPVLPGPMPADLVPRAAELVERQEQARAALVVALAGAQKQVAYAERVVDLTRRRSTEPIYLDLEA
ncbi:hypothetical protein [Marmoricola sp. RAF53]|uniref:hypothetical protein n=1 Tax=Marmoricola sp. RAF53 TaxID=3233059 RepID=UPI003F988E45